jgi:HK97 family phage major capsid protein
MPRLEDLQEKRNKTMNDAAALARKDGISSEERNTVKTMLADVDQLEEQIDLEQRFVKFETEQRSFTPPPRPQPGDGNADTTTPELRAKREKKALEQYLRFGEGAVHPELRSYLKSAASAIKPDELRDLGVGAVAGSITGGSQFVPTGFDPQLIQAQKSWGQLLDLVTIKRTATGAPVTFAYANDTGNGLMELAELAAPTEVDPALANGHSTTMMVSTGWIKVSLQELQDSAFDIDAFVRDIFGKRWFRGAVAKITAGSTDGTTVQSIVTGAAAGPITTSGTAIGYADYVALYGKLDDAYMPAASFAMNTNTRASTMGLTDTLGRPLFIPSTASGAPDTILGRPVVINQSLANIPTAHAAGIIPVQFGDFKQGYRFRVVNGEFGGQQGDLSIVRADQLFIGNLEIGFMGFGRIGGNVTDAGTHPLLNLTMLNA